MSYMDSLGIRMLPDYVDPDKGRKAMKMGEIACYLSHYQIWEEVNSLGFI